MTKAQNVCRIIWNVGCLVCWFLPIALIFIGAIFVLFGIDNVLMFAGGWAFISYTFGSFILFCFYIVITSIWSYEKDNVADLDFFL